MAAIPPVLQLLPGVDLHIFANIPLQISQNLFDNTYLAVSGQKCYSVHIFMDAVVGGQFSSQIRGSLCQTFAYGNTVFTAVIVEISPNTLSLAEWCTFLKPQFWCYNSSMNEAIALGQDCLPIFRHILDQIINLQLNHAYNGHLFEAIRITQDNKVELIISPYDSDNASLQAGMSKDLQDFGNIVSYICNLPNHGPTINGVPVPFPLAVHLFQSLFSFLPQCNGLADLREFTFFVDKNPLFLDSQGRYNMTKKLERAKNINKSMFTNLLSQRLSGWQQIVLAHSCTALHKVINYIPPGCAAPQAGQFAVCNYNRDSGILDFMRNAEEHIQQHLRQCLTELEVEQIIFDCLPHAIPVIFYEVAVFYHFQSNASCLAFKGNSLIRILE